MITCFSLGGRNIQFSISDQEIANLFQHLLRHHSMPDISHPDVRIRLVRQAFSTSQGYTPICLSSPSAEQDEWLWGVPSYPEDWTSEHFFYWIVSPLLSRVFATLQVVRLHGALLFDQTIGTLLFLGPRGAGKSSTVASWIECGGSMITDDTPLLKKELGEIYCYGLQRELHIDPSLAPFLPHLPELHEAREYLPGKQRVAYDWKRYFESQSKEVLAFPLHILSCQIKAEQPTSIEALSPDELEHLVQANIQEDQFHTFLSPRTVASVVEATKSARGWSVSWGKDIWRSTGKHRAFLLAHLSSQPGLQGMEHFL